MAESDAFQIGPDGAGRPDEVEALRRLCALFAAYDVLLAMARPCKERELAEQEAGHVLGETHHDNASP